MNTRLLFVVCLLIKITVLNCFVFSAGLGLNIFAIFSRKKAINCVPLMFDRDIMMLTVNTWFVGGSTDKSWFDCLYVATGIGKNGCV